MTNVFFFPDDKLLYVTVVECGGGGGRGGVGGVARGRGGIQHRPRGRNRSLTKSYENYNFLRSKV